MFQEQIIKYESMKALSQIFTVRIPSILAISAGIILSCFQLPAQSNDLQSGLPGDQDDSLYCAQNDSLHLRTEAIDSLSANAPADTDLTAEDPSDSSDVHSYGPEDQMYSCEDSIYSAVERSGKRFYQDGVLLGQKELESLLVPTPYTYQDIEKYSHGFAVGKGLLIGFGALAGVGGVTATIGAIGLAAELITAGLGTVIMFPIFAIAGDAEAGVVPFEGRFLPLANAGTIIFCAGALGLIAGTTVFCVYKARLNKVVRAINDSSLQRLNLSFGAQRYGVGFALNF